MTTQEIANRFHQLAQEGKWEQIQNELFSNDAKSIEPPQTNGPKSANGLEAIKKKGEEWNRIIEEMHSGYSNPPIVAGNHFSVAMGFDATMKGVGRQKSDEIAVYEVKEGKIVKEQFFF